MQARDLVAEAQSRPMHGTVIGAKRPKQELSLAEELMCTPGVQNMQNSEGIVVQLTDELDVGKCDDDALVALQSIRGTYWLIKVVGQQSIFRQEVADGVNDKQLLLFEDADVGGWVFSSEYIEGQEQFHKANRLRRIYAFGSGMAGHPSLVHVPCWSTEPNGAIKVSPIISFLQNRISRYVFLFVFAMPSEKFEEISNMSAIIVSIDLATLLLSECFVCIPMGIHVLHSSRCIHGY